MKTILADKIIKQYGYEYYLVETPLRDKWKEPSFMGMRGYALKAVKKIKK